MGDELIHKAAGRSIFDVWGKLKFRKLYIGAAYVMGAFLLAIAPTSSVFASTIWDNLLETTAALKVTQNNGSGPILNITGQYETIMSTECPAAYASYISAKGDEDGRIAIVQYSTGWFHVEVAWSENTSHQTVFTSDAGNPVIEVPYEARATLWDDNGDLVCTVDDNGGIQPIAWDYTITADRLWVYSSTYPWSSPSGYVGTEPSQDSDGDLLTAAYELLQGTSDSLKDTDGDDINDYIESEWNPLYDETFCSQTSPYTCADPSPTEKDLYIENDWLKDVSDTEYKPTVTQIGIAEDVFEDQGINLHYDTGQYGGGEAISVYSAELPYTATPGITDYFDFRYGNPGASIAKEFSDDREGIWRYLVTGYQYTENPSSSGWASVMSDSLFTSVGLIQDMTGTADLDRAIAGTIVHEIGHTLCLSSERIWNEQPAGCIFGGIDNSNVSSPYYNLEDYESVMNYRYQLTDNDDMGLVDLSDGLNGLDDHDDWSAVKLGIGKFNGSHTLYTP